MKAGNNLQTSSSQPLFSDSPINALHHPSLSILAHHVSKQSATATVTPQTYIAQAFHFQPGFLCAFAAVHIFNFLGPEGMLDCRV
jgi:hypothetical protein